jgi:acetyl esterase
MASTAPTIDRPAAPGVRRVADLRLRSRTGNIPVRVRWPHTPRTDAAPPLIVLLPDAAQAGGVDQADEELAVELCARAGGVVLCTPWAPRRSGALERAEAALMWTADHGAELGADPARIAIAGRGLGAAAAAALAMRARERGWPSVRREVLVLPDALWLRVPGGDVERSDDVEALADALHKALSERGEDR